jgi:peptidoglycan/LPS O-acetylase OafA/YrhL
MAVLGEASVEPEVLEDVARDDRPRLTHQPALDGLRGLAVAAVLLFHLERLEGGFLGVDLFFVLSGFLITSLLLVEQHGRGSIRLGRFWARRARRLLPALFVLLVGVAVLLVAFTPADQRPRFRGDALATLGYVANWHRLASDIGYWDIFSQPSPLDHTWSLAIEEQFYLLWPLLVMLVLWRRVDATRLLGWVALTGAAASFVLLAVRYSPLDTSRAYFGTDTRLGATLLGAGLATWTTGRERRPSEVQRRPSALVTAVGLAGLAWMAWSVLTVDGLSSWYYRGGLVSFAVAAVAVIVAVTHSPGLLGRAIGGAPLRWLGTISYGVYLWHWPIDVYLTPERAGTDGWRLDVLRVGLTLGVAALSYVVVEQPIRRGVFRGWPLRLAGGATVLASLAAVLVATAGTRAPTVDQERGFGPVPRDGSDNPYLLYPSDIPAGAMRVLIVGDSGAYNLGPRLVEEGERANGAVASSAPYYCNVMSPEGIQQLPDGTTMDRGQCHPRRLALWGDLIDEFDPDVVVYYLANAGSPGKALIDGEWLFDCDAAFDDYLTDALRDEAELLGQGGALVVFATSPHSRIPDPDANHRIDCRNAVYRDVVASEPGTAIADMQAFVEQQTEVADDAVFQDMVHLSVDGGRAVSAWLLPELGALLAE